VRILREKRIHTHRHTDCSILNEVPLLTEVPVLVPPSPLGTATAPGLRPSSPAALGRVVPVASATATAPGSGPPPGPPVSGPGPRAGATPTPAEAAAFAIPLGTPGIHADLELPAIVLTPVQGVHRVLRVPLVEVPDKGKAPAATGAALQREVDVPHVAVLLKQRHQILRLGTVGQVAHAQRGHPVDVAGRASETATAPTIAAISVRHA